MVYLALRDLTLNVVTRVEHMNNKKKTKNLKSLKMCKKLFCTFLPP